jgi:hypothetical protein
MAYATFLPQPFEKSTPLTLFLMEFSENIEQDSFFDKILSSLFAVLLTFNRTYK